ncbi:Replication protein A 70 kDa DNA-binding subunit C, partial [Bienertia sinuspersici]
DTVGDLKGKIEKVQLPQQLTRKTVCYRCQGLGHVAKQCPNRSMVTREEYYTFLLHNMDDILSDEQQQQHPRLNDITTSDFWESQPRCTPEYKGHVLVLLCTLLSTPEEDFVTQRCNLFHSKCILKDKVCFFIIDSGSCTNVCALTLADSLQLPMRKDPHSYKLDWLNDDGGVWVRK